MPAQRFRRTKWLIDSDIQVRLATKFAVYLLSYLFIFCLIALMDPLVVLLTGSAEEVRYTAAKAEIGLFFDAMLMPLGFAVACMALHGVLLLHRLAGPVYRVRRTLESLAERDLTDQIHLRDGDFLKSVAGRANDCLSTVRMDVVAAREDVAAILAAAKDEAVVEPARRLDTLLASYRTGSEAEPTTAEEPVEEPVASASEERA
jgi:hypothetical protein